MITEYEIKIPLKLPGEQIGCEYCRHKEVCQFHIEIFSGGRWLFKNTIAHRSETEHVGLLCKYFEVVKIV